MPQPATTTCILIPTIIKERRKPAKSSHSSMPERPGHLDFSRLPEEIWMRIFEFLHRSADLYNVVTTCWKLYALGIRSLYHHVDWRSPYDYIANLPFWQREHARFNMVPSTLVLGISCIQTLGLSSFDPTIVQVGLSTQHRTIVSHIRADIPNDNALSSSRARFVANVGLYNSLVDTVLQFANLKELIFHDCSLPSFIYKLIEGLHQLRHLTLQNCVLPPSAPSLDLDFENLPLTAVTLVGIIGNAELQMDSNYVHALKLCSSKGLQSLRVDWTGITSAYLAQWQMESGYIPPATLKSLAVHVPPMTIAQQDQEATHQSLSEALSTFLQRCPGLETLLLDGIYPSVSMPEPFLPSLKKFYGTITHGVLGILHGDAIEHLTIGSETKLKDLLDFLPRVAEVVPHIRSLTISLKRWDDEIIFALVQHFPNLAELQVKYKYEYPSHQTLLSLGAIHLRRMPNLEKLKITKIQPDDTRGFYRLSSAELGGQQLFNQNQSQQFDIPAQPTHQPAGGSVDWGDTPSLATPPSSSTLLAPLGTSPAGTSSGSGVSQPSYTHRIRRQIPHHVRTSSDPALSPDQDFKDFMLAWNKHCRKLLEVQFVPGVVWRRCRDGDEWCKRLLERQWEYDFGNAISNLPL